jgi:hypothetical protein
MGSLKLLYVAYPALMETGKAIASLVVSVRPHHSNLQRTDFDETMYLGFCVSFVKVGQNNRLYMKTYARFMLFVL